MTIAQWQAEVISLNGTVKFHSLNLFDFWKKCEACLTASYTIACKRVTEGVPQHPKIKQKVQAARPLWLKDVACDSWTKKRSTGISVCRDLLRTFQSWKVCDRTTTRRIKRQQIKGKTNQGITVLFSWVISSTRNFYWAKKSANKANSSAPIIGAEEWL